jgi:predicted dehydrogenase
MADIEADDHALLTVRMRNGALGTIEASKIATGANDELRFEIHGDRGALRFSLMEPDWLDFFDNTAPAAPLGGDRGFTRIECVQRFPKPGGTFPSPKNSIGWLRAHVHCLYNFVDCVHRGAPASPSFREGAYVQTVMERAYESGRTGKWIDLP